MTADEIYILTRPPENLTPNMLRTRMRLRDEQVIAWGTGETLGLISILLFTVVMSLTVSATVFVLLPIILFVWFMFQIYKTHKYNEAATELDIKLNPMSYIVVRDNIDLTKYLHTVAFMYEFKEFDKTIRSDLEIYRLRTGETLDKKHVDYIYEPYREVIKRIANNEIYKEVWVEKPDGWDDRFKLSDDNCGVLSMETYYSKHHGGL